MTELQVKTGIKVGPTLLRLFMGAMAVLMFFVSVSYFKKYLVDSTGVNLVSIFVYSFMSFFFMGLGPGHIANYTLNEQVLTMNILGIFKIKTRMDSLTWYTVRQGSNGFGTYDQLVLSKRNGQSVFIESFDQKNFEGLHNQIGKLLPHEPKGKPNYLTPFYKVIFIWLAAWIILMFICMIIGK